MGPLRNLVDGEFNIGSMDLEYHRTDVTINCNIYQSCEGLDDGVYGTVCSNILSMDPLPVLNRAYAMIVQEERHRSIARNKEERGDTVGFST